MSDIRMVARLADLPEFQALVTHFRQKQEEDVERLARKTYAMPENHPTLEWEKLKARHAGMLDVLGLPVSEREKLREEQE